MNLRNDGLACLALPDVQFLKDWEAFPGGCTGRLGFNANLAYYGPSDRFRFLALFPSGRQCGVTPLMDQYGDTVINPPSETGS